MTKVAVVTGGNKGIGLGIVRSLCKQFDGKVYLTSRDEERGNEAVKILQDEGLQPSFHQLDILDTKSIQNLRDYLMEKYGGIDILVNNAGVAFKVSSTEPVSHQAKVTVRTNYWGTKEVCDILFPLLKSGARVVNMSSSCGFLGKMDKCVNKEKGAKIKETLASDDLSTEQLGELMNSFVGSAADGCLDQNGWITDSYNVSKMGVSALSRIQQRQLDKHTSRSNIVVNHVHPGYVDTDMSSHKGPLTIDRGAQSAVFAALLPADTDIRGAYIWHDNQIVDWVNGPTPPMT